MALPAALQGISPALAKAGVHLGAAPGPEELALPFGIEALDQVLPDGGFVRGGVVELSVTGESSLLTTLSLSAVRSLQREGRASAAGRAPYCAFIDPSMSLYAPGVASLGIELERLIVVRPERDAIGRVAVKLSESSVFALVVVDTVGTLGAPVDLSLKSFVRIVRRLSMAVDGTKNSVLLLTSGSQPRSLPLPVAQRIEVARPTRDRLVVRVAKDKRGRVTPPRSLIWAHPSGIKPQNDATALSEPSLESWQKRSSA
jgi:recombination protein RecA